MNRPTNIAGGLGDAETYAYADGYTAGRRDAASGMTVYLDPVLSSPEFIAGYEAAIRDRGQLVQAETWTPYR